MYRACLLAGVLAGLACAPPSTLEIADLGATWERSPTRDGAPPPSADAIAPTRQLACATNFDCHDGLPCTVDRCRERRCTHEPVAGYCAIGGRCVADGELHQLDPCLRCERWRDATAWSSYTCTRTVAGDGLSGHVDGPAAHARFELPTDVAVGPEGEVYIADTFNHRIRVIRGGHVTTFAGSGLPGFTDAPARRARFKRPYGVAVAADGRVYVADTENERIRVIHGGQVSTLAGSGVTGLLDASAPLARFKQPRGVAVGADGRIYVADMANHRIRVIHEGVVRTLAGSTAGFRDGAAEQARFNSPADVAVSGGVVYVADMSNHRIRAIDAQGVRTLAGAGEAGHRDGLAASATFHWPQGVAVAGSAVYVADTFSHGVRRIQLGAVTTLAGRHPGYADSPEPSPAFNFPWGVDVVGARLYVADRNNARIRMIRF